MALGPIGNRSADYLRSVSFEEDMLDLGLRSYVRVMGVGRATEALSGMNAEEVGGEAEALASLR
jgi:hypothetical protein